MARNLLAGQRLTICILHLDSTCKQSGLEGSVWWNTRKRENSPQQVCWSRDGGRCTTWSRKIRRTCVFVEKTNRGDKRNPI